MKCRTMFSRKIKNISKCSLLKFLPTMLSVNHQSDEKLYWYLYQETNNCNYTAILQHFYYDEVFTQQRIWSSVGGRVRIPTES